MLSLDVPAARYAVLFDTGEKLKLSLLNVQPTSPTQRSTLKTPPVTAPQPRRLCLLRARPAALGSPALPGGDG